MPEQFKITYQFRLSSGIEKKFTLVLDGKTLSLIQEQKNDRPEWARLEFHQCANCPLNTTLTPYCPIAVNLSGVAWEFGEITSEEKAAITVVVKERAYFKAAINTGGAEPSARHHHGMQRMSGHGTAQADGPLPPPIRKPG